MSLIPRRKVVQAAVAAPVAAVGATSQQPSAGAGAARPRPDLIASENRKPGAADWQLTKVRMISQNGVRSPFIEGYCSRQSVEAGEKLKIMVSTDPPSRFVLEIFRTGYYGGQGARLVTRLGPFPGKAQPIPEVGPNRLRECQWDPAVEITIPDDWPSGVYLGRLTNVPDRAHVHAWQNYVVFIVKDRRRADILFQCSDNTWQAYNRWPDNYSLYTDPRHSWAPGVAVSFDRPYGMPPQRNSHALGAGEFLCWEFPLSYWLEMQGYDVTYCSNVDMLDAQQPLRAKIFISIGHDEYWDLRQYDSAMAAIKSGVTELYLSGNSVFGITPFLASSDGRPNRIIRRDGLYGGISKAEEEFFKIPFPVTGPDEALLMGAATPYPFNGGGDWIVTKPDHWVFAGTGMKKGDYVPGLVGWEFHGGPASIPGLEVLAEGDALKGGVRPSHWTATIYPGPKGNFVFNASTIFWAQGLSSPPGHMLPWSHWVRPHGPDTRVQRITQNLLRRALNQEST
jgi:hypothetical protein